MSLPARRADSASNRTHAALGALWRTYTARYRPLDKLTHLAGYQGDNSRLTETQKEFIQREVRRPFSS